VTRAIDQAAPAVARALPSTSSGVPLPPAVRAMMERAFNADFADVLIHPDSARAAALGARAYTEGNSVHLAPGQYDPESHAGRELIGHELAHVIQQRQGRVAATSQVRGVAINDAAALEQEADALGQRAASSASLAPGTPALSAAPAASPAPATHAVAQRQAAPQSNEETLDAEVEAAAQLEQSSVPAERAYGTRLVLLLTLMRPDDIDDDAALFRFIDRCQEFAHDEQLTLGFLAFRRDRNKLLEEDGAGFPAAWAERIAQELRIDADVKDLEADYQAERRRALDGVAAIGPTVWARGLPLTLDQARHIDADGLVRDVLNYRHLAAGSSEPTERYAAAMASWLRVAAHYGALLEHERDLADQVRQIRAGEVVVTRPYYKQQRTKFAELQAALQFVKQVGADPATVARKFFHVLSWTVGESIESFGGGGGATTTWPLDGVEAYRAELAKLDARFASASSADAITRALTWAHERGYLSAAGREVWNAIKADAVKMIATAVAILILQQIPGVNVALDVVLTIEFGLDAVTTLGEVVDTLQAAIRATSVVDMEHAAAMMATTIVGDVAKMLLWAATWGAAKAAKRIKSYRDGKKFLDEHSNSSEARAALAEAKGDIAKAKATLAKKRAQERRAREEADLNEKPAPTESDNGEPKPPEPGTKPAESGSGEPQPPAPGPKPAESGSGEPKPTEPGTNPPEPGKPNAPPPETDAGGAPRPSSKLEPPPRDSDGQLDFSGRHGKTLSRDCDSDPYAGESVTDTAARVQAAQQEVKARLGDFQPCFLAGTSVLTSDGPRPIECIEVGSRVLAENPEVPGSRRAYEVLNLYRGHARELRHIVVEDTTITATLNHRFYVIDHGWVAARDLAEGDVLRTAAGGLAAIAAITDEHAAEDVATFNFHVAQVSTYFVGAGTSVLVHNANPNFERTLWWLFASKAKFRAGDHDGVSLWRTENEQDVKDMFKIRKNLVERPSGDPHSGFTPEELASHGIEVEVTPGDGPMAGRLTHGSARPAAPEPSDLAPDQGPNRLSEAGIRRAVDGINRSTVAEKATPKSMGCK
jgi:hypothetical protein